MDIKKEEKYGINIRPLLKSEVDKVIGWYDSPYFYFDTENPDTCRIEDIEYYLEFDDSYFCIIEETAGPGKKDIGLLDLCLVAASGKANLEFQFVDYNDWQRIGIQTVKKITAFVFNTFKINRISKMIYGFDEGALNAFKKSGYNPDGKYSSLIYKNGRYWDVFVYSVSWEEFKTRKDNFYAD